MKRLLLALVLLLCVSCGTNEVEYRTDEYIRSRFIVVEETTNWYVVYDYETKVMYAVSGGAYNGGAFTMLADSTGKPLLWKGDEK